MYGAQPYTLTAGQLLKVEVAPQSHTIRIANPSRFDLGIVFAWNMPSVTATSVNGPGTEWVPANSVAIVDVPEDIYPDRAFTGILWIMPIDNTGKLATTGTSSNRQLVYVTAYGDGEQATGGMMSSNGTDLTSQPRIINLPVVPHISTYDSIIWPTTGSSIRAKFFYTFASPLTVAQPVTVYLYSMQMTVYQCRAIQFVLTLGAFDTGNVQLIATPNLMTLNLPALQPTWLPQFGPIGIQLTCPINTKSLGFIFGAQGVNSIGTHGTMDYNAQLDLDLTGQTPPPAIGNGAATPAGALY